MRRMEILSIRLQDIDIEKCMIFIPVAKSGSREQPMTKHLADYLKEYMKTVPTDQPWWFPSNRSKSGQYETIECPWRRALKAAGLEPYAIVRPYSHYSPSAGWSRFAHDHANRWP